MTYNSLHRYNLPMWRKALSKLKQKKVAVYPKLNEYGELEFYVLITGRQKISPKKTISALDRMRGFCYTYAQIPCSWIKIKYRTTEPKKVYYVKIIDDMAQKWLKKMRRDDKWKGV